MYVGRIGLLRDNLNLCGLLLLAYQLFLKVKEGVYRVVMRVSSGSQDKGRVSLETGL